ncbi:MAG: zinc ribbon domain-containing protein [Myxococcales bacterium]|nr:zinc ribbon domain-containing protein [Myxococcales bacterium]
MDASAAWPPTGARAEVLGRLALLIERGGAAHLLDAPIAHAGPRDFPEPWQPSAVAVERVLVRLLWLAHVDLDVALDDLRRYEVADQLLRRSGISWVETTDGVAHFQIETIGNDDVAGLLCHEVGLAYAAWIAGAAAYRDAAPTPPSERDGSIAAIYLGLGVVATNAALYNRVASKLVGQVSVSETDVVATGGLAPDEALYLLAVQAVLRGGVDDAHATLREDLRARLAADVSALRAHRDELAEHLGLDLGAPRAALARDAEPPLVGDRPEPSKAQRHAGERTYRMRESQVGVGLGQGFMAGMGFGAVGWLVGLVAPVVGVMVAVPVVIGGLLHRRAVDRCPRCAHVIPEVATTCPGCGATVAGRVASEREMAVRELERDD